MFLDLIDLAKFRRALIHALLLVLLFWLQDLLASYVTLGGVKAMFIPAAVVCVALFEGGVWGAMFGLAAGYLADLGFAENTVLFTLLFPAMGYFAGVLGKYVLRRAFITGFVLSAAALILAALCQMFPFFFRSSSFWAVLKTGVLQVLWSLPFAALIFFPCRRIAGQDLSD